MSRSAIYTVNTDIAVLEGGIIPLGAIVRRYGPCLDLNGNGITHPHRRNSNPRKAAL
jgi:hypothetical protein